MSTRHPLHNYIVSGDMGPVGDGESRSVQGFVVWYFCGGKRFQVLVSNVAPSEQRSATEVEWVKAYDQARAQGGPLTEFEMMATEKIKELAIHTIVDIAPPSTAEPPTLNVGRRKFPQTAEQLVDMYSSTVKLQLVTHKGELEVIMGHSPDIPTRLPPIPWTRASSLPPSDIRFIPTFPSTQVTLQGARLYGIERYDEFQFEATISGLDEPAVCLLMGNTNDYMDGFIYQLAKLIKIRGAGFNHAEVRVPPIKGT